MARKSLGKGLASLIPDFYNEDFDSNSTQSLEDIMNETENNEEIKDSEEKNVPKEKSSNDVNNNSNEEEISKDETLEESGNDETQKNIFEEIEEEKNNQEKSIDSNETTLKEDVSENIKESENISIQNNEKNTSTTQETKIQEHIVEVKEIVDKNPRITLWSSRSSAVFRYLRKTEPEFSISKEASNLIEEAVAKKYPEIWALFDDY